MVDFLKIPTSAKIDGIEYSFAKYEDLSKKEQAEVRRLTQRASTSLSRMETGDLSEEQASELDADLVRLVDLFLKSAPSRVRARLSGIQRLRVMRPIWRKAIKDAGLSIP